MENSLEINRISQHLEIEEEEEYDEVLNEKCFNEEEFLREILEQPENEEEYSPNNSSSSTDEGSALHESNSYNSIVSLENTASYLFSFHTHEPPLIHHDHNHDYDHSVHLRFRKRSTEGSPEVGAPKKLRGGSSFKKAPNHIMAERKRREELTRSIIALSATIPGLKKMDKAYVLHEAVSYMRKLQERVKELENEHNDGRADSATIFITKSQACSSKKSSTLCESNSDSSGHRYIIESLPEVEARVLENDVLIGIHCEKQNNIMLKIHVSLEKLHLSIAASSVLPFGTSTLVITIIAQMNEKCSMKIHNLVKNLREDLLG